MRNNFWQGVAQYLRYVGDEEARDGRDGQEKEGGNKEEGREQRVQSPNIKQALI